MQELMVGDLMREFSYSLDQVLNMGYYEAHRLWLIADEMSARDLQNQSRAMDFAYSDKERRQAFLDWVTDRQPRQNSRKNDIPEEVLKKFAQTFKGAVSGR